MIKLEIKVLFLIIVAFLLFPFFVTENNLITYCQFIAFFTVLLMVFNALFLGFKSFLSLVKLWFIGIFFYALIAIPLVFSKYPLTYSLILTGTKMRLLYVSLYPIRVLGVFLSGTIFIGAISPTEFLKYGKFGYYCAFFLRSVQVAGENIQANVRALKMTAEINEDSQLKTMISYIHKSPQIISLTIRNMMLWLFWSSNHFEKIKKRRGIK